MERGEETFACVVLVLVAGVVVVRAEAFPRKADSDFTIILSCIALTFGKSDGPFTSILLIK